MQAQRASSACRGKHISHHLAIVFLEPWTTSLRSTFSTTTDHESLRSSLTTSLEAPKNFAVWHVGHHPSPCHSCLSMCPVRQRTLRAAKEKPVSKGECSAELKLQATPAAVMLGECRWWHWALCVFWHTHPLPVVGQLWTSLSQDCGILLSLRRKGAGARACCVLTQSFPAQGVVQGISGVACQCVVRSSFCLVQPGSPVDLAAVLPAHKAFQNHLGQSS